MSLISSRRLLERLRQGERFLADGGIGTEIIKLGVEKEDVLSANLRFSDKVRDIHQSYLDAGSQIITTNTFGFRTGSDWADSVRSGISIGTLAARDSKVEAAVWVSLISNLVPLEINGLQYLAENSLHWPGAVLLETCTSLQTAVDALRLLKVLNLELTAATCHFGEDGLMPDGASPEIAAEALIAAGADIVGANCGENPWSFVKIAERMRAVTKAPLLIQPNAGLPMQGLDGGMSYGLPNEEFTEAAKQCST